MPRKKTQHKTHRIIPMFMSVLILGGVVFGLSLMTDNSPMVLLSSESREIGEFYIEPEDIELNMGSSEVFTAFIEEATNTLEPLADWSVMRDDEDATDFFLDCEGTAECTIYAGATEGEVIVMAEFDGQVASTTLDVINNEVVLGFSDEVPEWAEVDIAILNERGIMMGYADGSFGAEDSVTRGQFITLLYRLMPFYGIDSSQAVASLDCDLFSDVGDAHYAYEPICFAEYYGWLDELELGSTLSPDQELTRAETAELFAGAIGRSVAENLFTTEGYGVDVDDYTAFIAGYDFFDVNVLDTYASGIGLAYGFDIMTGDGTYFRPDDTLNRAETAVIIWRILDSVIADLDVEFNLDEDALEAYESGV